MDDLSLTGAHQRTGCTMTNYYPTETQACWRTWYMTRDCVPIPLESLRWAWKRHAAAVRQRTAIPYLPHIMGPCWRRALIFFTNRLERIWAVERDGCSGTEYGTAFIWDDGKGAEDFPVLVYALLFYSFHGRLSLIGHKLGRSLQLQTSPVTV